MESIKPDPNDEINSDINPSQDQVQKEVIDKRGEFVQNLLRATPIAWVTPTVVVINSLVFLAMVITGVSIINPAIDDLLKWGADFGLLTVTGEWWRLLTSAFVHIGIIHIALNMWCLWDAGRLAERLFGNVAYILIYIFSAIGGCLISISANPVIVSAGASGAVFGVFGSIVAFILLRRNTVPTYMLESLKRSIFPFIGYNLIFGFVAKGVDNAAHIGGLVTGFVAGMCLVRSFPVTASLSRRYLKLTGVVIALIALGFFAQYRVFANPVVRVDKKVREHFDLGGKYYDAKKYREAILEFTKVVELDSSQDGAYYNRALANYMLKEYEKALTDLTRAIDINSKNSEAYAFRGDIYFDVKEFSKAVKDYSKAIELDPSKKSELEQRIKEAKDKLK